MLKFLHALNMQKFFFVASNYDEEVSKGLKRSMPFLRSQLAKKMTTRGIPKLHFVYDKTIDESMKISRLLDGVLNADK